MYEFTCQHCGIVKTVKYKNLVGKFCGYGCANKARNRQPHVDLSYDWKAFKVGHRTHYMCRYNEGISCTDRNCAKCGWNPEVAQRRTMDHIQGKGAK